METSYAGTCLCGLVSFEVIGRFESFFLCHCKHCQKDTGSANAANLFSTSAKLKWILGEAKVRNYNLLGTRHNRSFCTNCGSALPNVQAESQLLVVPAGSLDSPVLMKPDAHLFTKSKADWDKDLESITRFEKLPC